MTWTHIFVALCMAGFPMMVALHLYSRRHFFCGKIYVDHDEQLIHCYPRDGGKSQVFDDQTKAIEFLIISAKPDIQRARIFVCDKKPKE